MHPPGFRHLERAQIGDWAFGVLRSGSHARQQSRWSQSRYRRRHVDRSRRSTPICARSYPSLVAALEFLALTATRAGEVRFATWEEIDWEERLWSIPPGRTKTGKLHRVPLSSRAMAVLEEAKTGARGPMARGLLIFPSMTGKPIANGVLPRAMKAAGIDAVPHGFRSSFRDWCGETGVPREVAEMCLAHVVGGVEGAYARSDLFDRRRPVMEEWGKYLR